jgi:hypothetical protein
MTNAQLACLFMIGITLVQGVDIGPREGSGFTISLHLPSLLCTVVAAIGAFA